MRRFIMAFAAGAAAGYAAMRAVETAVDLVQPYPPLAKDAARYGRTRRRLMLAGMARSLNTLGLIAFGFAAPLERATTTTLRFLNPGLFFVATTTLGSLLELPVDYIEDHVLERTYAMSEQSRGAWLTDRAKSVLLTDAVGGVLTVGAVALMRRYPRSWPWLASAATVPLLMLANVVGPTFIAPFFNEFTPLTGPLEARIRALAARYGAGDAAILRVDMSKQTAKANAYVTGIFGTKRIVVGDTLLDGFTDDEVMFVVAHELGHYVNADAWRAIVAGTLAGTVAIAGAHSLRRGASGDGDSSGAYARFAFYASLIATALGPAMAAFSRSVEWQADRFALAATEDPKSGVTAFSRLRDRNLAEDEQPRWMELLFSSHPSLRARIVALKEAM